MRGPSTGPKKGEAEKTSIGLSNAFFSLPSSEEMGKIEKTYVPTSSFLKTSEIHPPETDKNADPKNPVKNRKIISTAILLAKATGKLNTTFPSQ